MVGDSGISWHNVTDRTMMRLEACCGVACASGHHPPRPPRAHTHLVHPPVVKQLVVSCVEAVKEVHYLARLHLLTHLGEPADVGEKNSDLGGGGEGRGELSLGKGGGRAAMRQGRVPGWLDKAR